MTNVLAHHQPRPMHAGSHLELDTLGCIMKLEASLHVMKLKLTGMDSRVKLFNHYDTNVMHFKHLHMLGNVHGSYEIPELMTVTSMSGTPDFCASCSNSTLFSIGHTERSCMYVSPQVESLSIFPSKLGGKSSPSLSPGLKQSIPLIVDSAL